MNVTNEFIEALEGILNGLRENLNYDNMKTTKRKVDTIKDKFDLDLIKFADKMTTDVLSEKGKNEKDDIIKTIFTGVFGLLSGKGEDIIRIYDLLFDENKIVEVEDMSAIKAKKEIDRITMEVAGQITMMMQEALEVKIEAIIQNGKKILGS